ncbi:hypothetical protein QIS74_05638 [Colletotrichum tabaci]|uniref:Carboxylic ester hydrolase n=1 Tax=Colletotrichum tabaci TaxID=1209068 RepID=A0AAV9THD8_9PEZI
MLSSLQWSAWGPQYWALSGSIVSFAAMVVLLARFDDEPIFAWQGITLNAVISILSVAMKAAVAFVISECLAQWKWVLFTREDRPLIDFDRIDSATRGPLGSLRILLGTKGAFVVKLGAVLTLLAVALDPLAQQIIQVREIVVYTQTNRNGGNGLPALNSGTESYSMGRAIRNQRPLLNSTLSEWSVTTDLPLSMQGAILNGISKPPSEVEQEALVQCPTSNCTWNQFSTVGICHRCNDVSSELRPVQDFGQVVVALANTTYATAKIPSTAFTLPNGHFIANIDGCPPYNGRFPDCENEQSFGVYSDSRYTVTSYGTAIPSRTNTMKDIDTLIWSMSIIHPDMEALNKSVGFTPGEYDGGSKAGLKLWPDVPLKATECALYYCVKNIDSKIEGNRLVENIAEAKDALRDPESFQRYPELNNSLPETVITEEANGTLEFDKYWSAVGYSDLRLWFPDNKTQNYFRISSGSVLAIGEHMQKLFRANLTGSSDQRDEIEKKLGRAAVGFNGASFGPYEELTMQATPPALNGLWAWTRHNVSSTFYALATTMTNEMRRNFRPGQNQQNGPDDSDGSQDGTMSIYGRVGRSTVLYHIRWPWIALHGLMIVSAIGFLSITLSSGSFGGGGDVPLWKSSSLAAIRHGRDVGGVLGSSKTLGDMASVARRVHVNLRGDGGGDEAKACIDRSAPGSQTEL